MLIVIVAIVLLDDCLTFVVISFVAFVVILFVSLFIVILSSFSSSSFSLHCVFFSESYADERAILYDNCGHLFVATPL